MKNQNRTSSMKTKMVLLAAVLGLFSITAVNAFAQAAYTSNNNPPNVPHPHLINHIAHSGYSVPTVANAETPLDSMILNCPNANGCVIVIEIETEVGDAPLGATPYDWSIFPRIDGACGVGCGVQGLVRTDSQPNNGWITGNTHLFSTVSHGNHTVSAGVETPYVMNCVQWQVYYSVYK